MQKPDRTRAVTPPTPSTPAVRQGKTGEIIADTSPDPTVYIFNWRLAVASAPDVYVQHGQTTSSAITFGGLTPGEIYNAEVNAVGTTGTSDWSDDRTMMVV